MQSGVTLSQFVAEHVSNNGNSADAEQLGQLVNDVALACIKLAALVRQGELAGVLGAAGAENVQGEQQKKLDVIANDVFIEMTERTGTVAGLASEEMDHHYPIPQEFERGNYLLTFDPLDGSSNIDVNGATGTIFSITQHNSNASPTDNDFLQPGRSQVCAGYCLYSSASMLVLTFGNGVGGFTLDANRNEFVLSHPNMSIPAATSEFAINAAYAEHWQEPVKRYIAECVAGKGGPLGKAFNMRWAGSMVGDIHRILCRGGIFLYPLDNRMISENKAGKLRLLYEANPMGWLIEQAGGLAHTGLEPILDINPHSLHQRVPVIMGSSDEVQRVVSYHTASS